jgi:hypothetical protein
MTASVTAYTLLAYVSFVAVGFLLLAGLWKLLAILFDWLD